MTFQTCFDRDFLSAPSVLCDNGQLWFATDYVRSHLLKYTMVTNESSTVGIGDARNARFLYQASLLDPEKWQIFINRTEVYEYYYIQHGTRTHNGCVQTMANWTRL